MGGWMSKYLKALTTVAQEAKASFRLLSDCLLVEILKDEEFKTKSGLILASGTKAQINGIDANKPTWIRILMVGEGFYDNAEDGSLKLIPLETKPGDLALVGKNAIEPLSVFGRIAIYGETQLGFVRDSEIRMRFDGQEGFDKFFEVANSVLTNGPAA